MDFLTPPMYDVSYIDMWKFEMSTYIKALGIDIYYSTIKDSYFLNGKNLEANAKALHTLRSPLNDEYLSMVSNFDSAFVVWNTLVSLGEQKQNYGE